MTRAIIVILVSAFLNVPLFARTFLGIEEFTNRSEVKRILYKNYNDLVIYDDGSDVKVVDPSFAGFKFSLATFYFTPIDGSLKFNAISFQRWFSSTQLNDAKKFRDAIMSSLRGKYEDEIYVEFIDDQGFKACEFGTQEKGALGILEIRRSKGGDNKERLYVFLTYYAFDPTAVENEL